MVNSATILVAEDDSDLRRAAASALARAGYTVLAAEDGEKALENARTQRVDLFLVDLIMPGLNGFQLSQELRKFTAAAILVWTTSSQREMIRQAFSSGADDLVTKAQGFRHVLARIERLLTWSGTSWPNAEVPQPTEPVARGELRFDQLFGEAYGREQRLLISPVECQFLYILWQAANRQATRQQLAAHLFGDHLEYSLDGIDIIAERLRSKIESNSARPMGLALDATGSYRLAIGDPSAPAPPTDERATEMRTVVPDPGAETTSK